MPPTKSNFKKAYLILVPVILIAAFSAIMNVSRNSSSALIVYCSHDSVFAEKVLKRFTEQTGIEVIPKYDTEASKSLGLTEKILYEKEKSECDVYWSNEILSMPALKNAEMLLKYKGDGYNRIPDKYKDLEGYWCGFAARLRVIIYNKDLFKGSEEDIDKIFKNDDLSKVAIALPLYGTTLTHFASLWLDLSSEKLKAFYNDLKERNIQIVQGNGPSRNLVANGTCSIGWTDTDDYFGAVDKKAPVGMYPCRLSDKSTICIPNTVGIIKHTDKLQQAKKLVEFLLSEQNETALANSSSRQIPLGKVSGEIADEVKKLIPFAMEGTDLKKIFPVRDELVKWIKEVENLK
ncbi:MAG: extracellular solute-binding protein [Lentisphaeraceae bacterium]|nr:extracellular solute-binding protein [Lentisphaeraceae bacterium]